MITCIFQFEVYSTVTFLKAPIFLSNIFNIFRNIFMKAWLTAQIWDEVNLSFINTADLMLDNFSKNNNKKKICQRLIEEIMINIINNNNLRQ